MAMLRFSGMMAVLLLMAGCAVPVGYPGYYGGYNGYDAYSGAYASPYASVPVVPYGYTGVTPYYGYGYDSSNPVIVNNQIPVPVYPNHGTASGPCTPSEPWYSSHHRERRHYYGNQDHHSTSPITPGDTTSGLETSANPTTDSSGTTCSQGSRFNRWQRQSGQPGTDPSVSGTGAGSVSGTGTSSYGQNRGSQTSSSWNRPLPGSPPLSGSSQNISGNQTVPVFGNVRRYPPATGQPNLASQPRTLPSPRFNRTPPVMTGAVGRAPSGPGLTYPQTAGTTAMRAPQRPVQGQTSGNVQKRVVPGTP